MANLSEREKEWNLLTGNILHRGKQDKEYADHPPMAKINYTYHYPLNTIIMAYLNKYTWETRMQMTTIAAVAQSNPDEFTYLRRQETLIQEEPNWEKVTVNRKTRTMTCDCIGKNGDRSD